jgi:N-acetylmuramoyl-L-alanine amidase
MGNTNDNKNRVKKESSSKNSSSTRNYLLISFTLIAIIFIFFGGFYLLKTYKIIGNNSQNSTEETTTKKVIIKNFVGTQDATFDANVSKYYTYGTSLDISGFITNMELSDTDKAYLVLKQAYTNEDGTTNSQDLYQFPLTLTKNNTGYDFSSYEKINTGIDLEQIQPGEYCMLLKIVSGSRLTYGNLLSTAKLDSLTYYSITKNGINNKIDLAFVNNDNTNNKDNTSDDNSIDNTNIANNYLSLNCAISALPEDVYDIVLDPGHGGNDPGAVNGDYNERAITLDYAQAIKASLEAMGYKVLLTRDGTESSDEWMAYTMYNKDGRVNVACASNAKICLSLHLNSNEVTLSHGGIQTYFSCRADESFSKTIVDEIVSTSGAKYSPMSAYKIDQGIYTRAFTDGDISESQNAAVKDGYTPYNVEPNTDYYFMIRELGGVATGAYVDGRNTKYGSNLYRDSLNGVETCIIELGFISVDEDLNHILNNKNKYVDGIVNGIIKGITN